MPFYEYVCEACQHQFDALQKVSDAPLTECPECHKPRLQKLISAPAFHLKGDGWYVTDFRDKDKGKGTDKDKADGTPSKDDKKTDTTTDNTKASKKTAAKKKTETTSSD